MKSPSSLFAIAATISALTVVGSPSDAVALGHEPARANNQCLSVLPLTYHQDLQIDRLRDSSVRQSTALDLRISQ